MTRQEKSPILGQMICEYQVLKIKDVRSCNQGLEVPLVCRKNRLWDLENIQEVLEHFICPGLCGQSFQISCCCLILRYKYWPEYFLGMMLRVMTLKTLGEMPEIFVAVTTLFPSP